MAASEFEALVGGAKGGGKSDVIMHGALRQVHKPAYKALILRETYAELEELMRRADRLWSQLPEKPAWNAGQHRWDFPNPLTRTGAGGASIKFGHCQYLKHVERYQGGEWGYVGFDELGNVRDEKIWIDLLKEIRCPDPTVRLMARGSANPGYAGHGWNKRRFIRACGNKGERVYVFEMELPNGLKLRQTRRYVPMRITDNPVYANDAAYLATLYQLPLERRKQLLEGDWDAGVGLALPELDPDVHIIPPFMPPKHWFHISGFDWGFAHWWVFVDAVVNEDGRIFVTNTIKGRRELPDVIAHSIRSLTNLQSIKYTSAGHDAWHVHRAHGESGPTIAEHLQGVGVPLIKANIDPIHGLNNLRLFTAWRERGPDGGDGVPDLVFFDTPGNRWLVEQCESMVTDPDNPEKVLKVDADPESGEGGDDGFQALQYLVASRPANAPALLKETHVRAFSEAALAHEADESRRVRNAPVQQDDTGMIHPEFGSIL